jgi:hypothetical protein
MVRMPAFVVVLGLGIVATAACDRQRQASSPAAPAAPAASAAPAAPVYAPAAWSPAAAPLETPSVSTSDNQTNWPARSGLNNDPLNPSGAPGPTGTYDTDIMRQ